LDALEAGADGVIVLHGSDTMHYTASALSFMLRNLSVPVVLTGSMIPGGDPRSDGIRNLADSITVASSADLAEVCVVFSADPEGNFGVIIRGCRAKKTHSHALNAFASINVPPIGYIRNGKISFTRLHVKVRDRRKLKMSTDLDPNVVLVKQNPGLTPHILKRFLEGASGAVIEGTGTGRVKTELLDEIRAFKFPVVLTSQAIYGGERLGMYELDKAILSVENIIPARDMNSEAALVKLMWALGRRDDVKSLMLTNMHACMVNLRILARK